MTRRAVGGVLFVVGLALAAAGLVRTLTKDEAEAPPFTREEITAFASEIAAGFHGDADTLVSSLHPNVVAVYGGAQCEAFYASVEDPAYAFEVQAVHGPGRWEWTADGLRFPVEWAYELEATRTRSSGSDDVRLHVSVFDDRLVWFGDCGDPVPR